MNLIRKALALALLAFTSVLSFASASDTARVVKYSDKDIVAVKSKVRFSTLIVLPKNETILDYTTGDKEFWIINGSNNFCYVKPAKPGIKSNINLITASGNVYSFSLAEVSNTPDSEDFDLKVFIEPKEESQPITTLENPKFVPAAEVEAYKAQAEAAQAKVEEAVSKFKSEYPLNLKFDYDFAANTKPFLLSAIYHDGQFTYIKSNAQEKPVIYEVKDGKPNLVNFDFKDGMYVIPKVLDSGYLAIGKKRLGFERRK